MSNENERQPEASRVVVVAGKAARDQARRFSVYRNHNRRSFRPSRWIAFYADNVIDMLAEIDGPPEDDVVAEASAE